MTSFNSTSKLVEDILEGKRPNVFLGDDRDRSIKDELARKRRPVVGVGVDRNASTLHEWLERDESSLDALEDEEDASSSMNRFSEIEDRLDRVGGEFWLSWCYWREAEI